MNDVSRKEWDGSLEKDNHIGCLSSSLMVLHKRHVEIAAEQGSTRERYGTSMTQAKASPEIGKSIQVGNIKTNYHEAGSGEPVILIHGS